MRVFWLLVVAVAIHGQEPLRRVCSGCHPVEVVTAARHTADEWRNVVTDMVARGAPARPSDVSAIVSYLATYYGKAASGGGAALAPTAAGARAAAKTFNPRNVVTRAEQWPAYGHDAGGQRYSPLTQLTPGNVGHLQRAWTFHMGAAGSEATPLVIDSRMYVTAPDAVFALQPETGKVIWKYATRGVARRGLAYWEGGGMSGRLFCGVESGKLIALDAKTGKPVQSFGDNGLVDLKAGVAGDLPEAKFFLASPPAIYKNVVITGGNNGELAPSKGAYGDVRGWDARTGKLLWTFHTVPRAGEPGNETWARGSWLQRSGTNVWGIMTVDAKLGMVYLPIGCPTSDMYGADRAGDGLYGNSLVALDALSGELKWFHQLVHHDLWDYDAAAPPALIDVKRDGQTVAAVAQMTKMSLLFLFDRKTGEPIYGLEERPMPASQVPGEAASRTQPFPLKPSPLARMNFEPGDLYDLTPDQAQFCRELLTQNKLVTQGPYTPMPVDGNALTFPSTLGGGNWGGVSFDAALGYVFTNVMNLGQWGHMERKQGTYVRVGGTSGAYARFWEPESHIPCTKPPFGELVAVNVNSGEIAWRVPLGSVASLEAKGVKHTGTLSMGGSIATASGLVFIAATNDARIRAFDARNGDELWSAVLDTSAYAVPVTYRGRDGRQYVAVVAGGTGFFASPAGDSVIAFAL